MSNPDLRTRAMQRLHNYLYHKIWRLRVNRVVTLIENFQVKYFISLANLGLLHKISKIVKNICNKLVK